MSQLVKAASKNEIAPGCAKKIEVDGGEAALFNCGGTFYAIEETCPHRGGPLSEGSLEGTVVACPWHGWQYDVTSGACLTNPSVNQKKYAVKVEGNDIFVSS
jgi:nitrite reductase/ring-hydroxylating ferredoxin subunit